MTFSNLITATKADHIPHKIPPTETESCCLWPPRQRLNLRLNYNIVFSFGKAQKCIYMTYKPSPEKKLFFFLVFSPQVTEASERKLKMGITHTADSVVSN